MDFKNSKSAIRKMGSQPSRVSSPNLQQLPHSQKLCSCRTASTMITRPPTHHPRGPPTVHLRRLRSGCAVVVQVTSLRVSSHLNGPSILAVGEVSATVAHEVEHLGREGEEKVVI